MYPSIGSVLDPLEDGHGLMVGAGILGVGLLVQRTGPNQGRPDHWLYSQVERGKARTTTTIVRHRIQIEKDCQYAHPFRSIQLIFNPIVTSSEVVKVVVVVVVVEREKAK